jgi:hypothetical protein
MGRLSVQSRTALWMSNTRISSGGNPVVTLKSRIQQAFADVPRPSDDAIFESDSEGAESTF